MWDSSHTYTHHIINQIEASQLIDYSADLASAFSWVVTYGIRAGLVTSCGLKDTTHKVGPNKDVRDLSGGDCDAPI